MNRHLTWVKQLLWVLLLGVFLAAAGCEGTESRESVNDTVEELAGKKDLERYQQMKNEIGEIQTRQEERLHQMDSEADDQ